MTFEEFLTDLVSRTLIKKASFPDAVEFDWIIENAQILLEQHRKHPLLRDNFEIKQAWQRVRVRAASKNLLEKYQGDKQLSAQIKEFIQTGN